MALLQELHFLALRGGGHTVPGSTVPGSSVPGSIVPGSTVPGSTLPWSTVPCSTVPDTSFLSQRGIIIAARDYNI